MQVLEKNRENCEQLGWQARPGIKTGTSRLRILREEPLGHWVGPAESVFALNKYFLFYYLLEANNLK